MQPALVERLYSRGLRVWKDQELDSNLKSLPYSFANVRIAELFVYRPGSLGINSMAFV